MNKELWIKEAKARGIEAVEIFEQKSSSTGIEVYEQKVDSFTISECDGIALRGIYNGKMGICYLEDASDENMNYAMQQIISNANSISSQDEVEIFAGEASYPKLHTRENTIRALDSEEKIALLKKLEKAILDSDSRIEQVMSTSYSETEVTRSIQNSLGLSLEDKNSYSMFVAEVMAKEQDDVKSDFDWLIAYDKTDLDIDAFAKQLSEKVCAKLNATQLPSGTYPVMIDANTMNSLLGALSGMFDGENAYKGISILKDSLGKQIFDEKITIVDDSLLKDGYNTCAFDDEGVACRRKTVVAQGVLKTYLHNLKSAKLMKTQSTGNGFKGSYAGSVGISTTNFLIEEGSHSYEEMVESMEQGVIITEVNGLHAGLNSISTEFSLQSSGFYVEHGKIVKPINLITVAGNFMDAMKHIRMVGNDRKMSYTGIGCPSIMFESLAVSGE